MFATSSPQQQQQQVTAQYTLQSQSEEQQQQQGSEDMFFALERLLMGISPFPPTMPTLAKPTCPSLDDQIMSEIQTPSSIPSIVLNEQSLDLLQQFYQNQDNMASSNGTQSNNNNNNNSSSYPGFQYQSSSSPSQHDHSDCSSTSRSASPPSSPYSYASSLVSSPAMPLATDPFWVNGSNASLYVQSQQQQAPEWDASLFEQISLPLTVPGLEDFITPTVSESNSSNAANGAFLPTGVQSMASIQSLKQATPSSPFSKRVKPNHSYHRRSSSSSSGLSAYEAPVISREHRASSICSTASSSTTTACHSNSNGSQNMRPVKSYACPTCTKSFPTRTQLKSHMAIHTDSFPFPCLYAGCELHFKRKHDLRRHVDAKHALVKKYLCTGGCGEGFGRRDQMVRHLRRGTCGQGQGFQTE
ncbi:hypothetical protein EDD11_002466 [Mortierella claussenii]|nr:hypothetical protein EDD11_002466 [Mortierella claussenii]